MSAEPIDLFLPCFEYYNLYSLLELIYKGSTTVYQRNLSKFIDKAEELYINISIEKTVDSQPSVLKPDGQLKASSLLTEQSNTRTESVIKYIKSFSRSRQFGRYSRSHICI